MQTPGKLEPAAVGSNQLQPPEHHHTLPTAAWLLLLARARAWHPWGQRVQECDHSQHSGADGCRSVFLTWARNGSVAMGTWLMPRGVTACAVCAPCAKSSPAVPVVLLQPRALSGLFGNPWYLHQSALGKCFCSVSQGQVGGQRMPDRCLVVD